MLLVQDAGITPAADPICEVLYNAFFLLIWLYALPFSFLAFLTLLMDNKKGPKHLFSLVKPFMILLGIISAGILIVAMATQLFPFSTFNDMYFIGYSLVGFSPVVATLMSVHKIWIFIKSKKLPAYAKTSGDIAYSIAIFIALNVLIKVLEYFLLSGRCLSP